jgi:DNA-binding HxlR family transcriptional regulator/putative sterol carrier protein
MRDKRHYGQFCGLAAGLDIVGERWTFLILRELLLAPARFSEIAENLPGIGPNLLSERLRSLTVRGLIEAEPVPGDGRGKQYRLTGLGEELRGPLLELARWGMRFLSDKDTDGISRGAWGFLAVQAMMHGVEVPSEVNETYEFRVDEDVFGVNLANGKATAVRGAVLDPAIVVRTDANTFIKIGAEILSPFEAVVSGVLRIEGDTAAAQRCARLLGLSQPGDVALTRH